MTANALDKRAWLELVEDWMKLARAVSDAHKKPSLIHINRAVFPTMTHDTLYFRLSPFWLAIAVAFLVFVLVQ